MCKLGNSYQIGEEGFHPKRIQSEAMMFTRGREIMVNLDTDMHSTAGAVERGSRSHRRSGGNSSQRR